ncbi:MAG: methionyl-tRNA formyltransferase [bacterium]
MNKRIIWLSANRFGYELLKEAVKQSRSNIKAIVTLSKKTKIIMYDGLSRQRWYDFKDIDVYEVESINNDGQILKRLSPDFLFVCGWREIISRDILRISKYGTIGFHPSLLPEGRGPAPIINSILQGIRWSGVTMFYLDKGLDNGDIIGQEKFVIGKDDYAEDIYNKVISAGKELINRYLPLLISGNAPRKPQDELKATYFKKLSLKNNEIDIENESTKQIYDKIRAFSSPYRGAYIKKGDKKIVIWRAEIKDIR